MRRFLPIVFIAACAAPESTSTRESSVTGVDAGAAADAQTCEERLQTCRENRDLGELVCERMHEGRLLELRAKSATPGGFFYKADAAMYEYCLQTVAAEYSKCEQEVCEAYAQLPP